MSATRIMSSQYHDGCTQHKKCHTILKHVLKPYDSRSHNQNVTMTFVYNLCLMQAARATKVA